MLGSNVVLSASTSSGKSLVIDEMIASDRYKKVVIIVPTLALIDETRRRLRGASASAVLLSRIRANGEPRTDQRVRPDARARAQSRGMDDVDFFVVDEFIR